MCTMGVEERLGELEEENGVGVWDWGWSPMERLSGCVKDRSMEELRWQSMDPAFLLSEVIVEAEVVEMEANKAFRSAVLKTAIAAGSALKQQQRARRAAASAVDTDSKTTKKSGHSNSIPGCYSDQRTARAWASAVMKRNSLTKRKTTSSTPDLSLVVNGASNPVFGDRKQIDRAKDEGL